MTPEYREAIIKDIQIIPNLGVTGKIGFDADSINLTYVFVSQTMCEALIKVCDKHRALFAIENTPTPLIKISIFQKQSNV